ncbi:MAG TPA: sigma-70 family RNA polymerase sigma factor [Gemmata sp.]
MSPAHVADLTAQFAPLALAVAGQFARSMPHLRDEFASDAGLALFRALSSPSAELPGANLGALVRVAVRNAVTDRIRYEARRATVQFADATEGDHGGAALALIPGREPEPGAELEAADELAALVRRAGLTEDQRAALVMVFGADEVQEVAESRGVSVASARQLAGRALERVRAAV